MLPVLQAERQLAAIEAAAVPHMTERGRQKTLARYSDEESKPVTPSGLAAIGISVEYVDAEGRPVDGGTSQDKTGVAA